MRQYVSQFLTIIIPLLLGLEKHANTTHCIPVPTDTGIIPAAKGLNEIISSIEK
jgi:hypothetical protein